MAAACAICEAGFKVALVEREEHPGGILLQCIHNGFGLHHFKQELTGPEYADEYVTRLAALPVHLYLQTTVVDMHVSGETKRVVGYSPIHGVLELETAAVVLAMGCRERNRGNIGIPGTRPAGVFTAGLAQRLLNVDGLLPGKRVVIIGSGDIGLIMARRMTWVGCSALGVVEILPYPSGLTRNIVQCLQDFGIPLHLSHTVTKIRGHDRVEGVCVSPLVNGVPSTDGGFELACDTVLLSVGLIPENELTRSARIRMSANTNGPVVDHDLQTSAAGVFACGNVLHVHDLVDFVSEEADLCGRSVVSYLRRDTKEERYAVPVSAGANLKYVVPNTCASGRETRFRMRAGVVREKAELVVRQGDNVVHRAALRHVRPAEMLLVTISKQESFQVKKDETLEFAIL